MPYIFAMFGGNDAAVSFSRKAEFRVATSPQFKVRLEKRGRRTTRPDSSLPALL